MVLDRGTGLSLRDRLLQLFFPEVEHLGEDVVAGVATKDAVVAIGVVVHVELLVGLY